MAQPWLEEDGLLQIKSWARDGLTDVQIAKNMGIGQTTLKNWKKDYVSLMSALKKTKEVVDFEVENALYKRAVGFHYEEEKTYIEEVNGKRRIRKETYKRYALPDTTAQIFWLKNRKPLDWRNKIEIEDTGDIKKLDILLETIKNASNE